MTTASAARRGEVSTWLRSGKAIVGCVGVEGRPMRMILAGSYPARARRDNAAQERKRRVKKVRRVEATKASW